MLSEADVKHVSGYTERNELKKPIRNSGVYLGGKEARQEDLGNGFGRAVDGLAAGRLPLRLAARAQAVVHRRRPHQVERLQVVAVLGVAVLVAVAQVVAVAHVVTVSVLVLKTNATRTQYGQADMLFGSSRWHGVMLTFQSFQ